MNNIEVIFKYDKIVSTLSHDIKNSDYKLQYFLDLLGLKRGFFYKKIKENRFTSDEVKKLAKSLYPEAYKDFELTLIDKALHLSREEIKEGKTSNFRKTLNEIKKQVNAV